MSRFVFLNAEDGAVVVEIENEVVGSASTAEELAELFREHAVSTADDNVYFSSSLDFASEEGFDSDDAAHEIVDTAFEILG